MRSRKTLPVWIGEQKVNIEVDEKTPIKNMVATSVCTGPLEDDFAPGLHYRIGQYDGKYILTDADAVEWLTGPDAMMNQAIWLWSQRDYDCDRRRSFGSGTDELTIAITRTTNIGGKFVAGPPPHFIVHIYRYGVVWQAKWNVDAFDFRDVQEFCGTPECMRLLEIRRRVPNYIDCDYVVGKDGLLYCKKGVRSETLWCDEKYWLAEIECTITDLEVCVWPSIRIIDGWRFVSRVELLKRLVAANVNEVATTVVGLTAKTAKGLLAVNELPEWLVCMSH